MSLKSHRGHRGSFVPEPSSVSWSLAAARFPLLRLLQPIPQPVPMPWAMLRGEVNPALGALSGFFTSRGACKWLKWLKWLKFL